MLLLVDDDEAMASSLADLLEMHGYKCDVAHSAEMALSRMQNKRYDLVLLDMVMRGIGGPGFLERYDTIAPNTKVIVLTAFPTLDTAVPALSGGTQAKAIAYLEKPVDNEALLRIIQSNVMQWEFDGLSMNLMTNQLTYDGRSINLSKRPFSMMQVFMSRPEQWLTYQDIGLLLDGLALSQTDAVGRYKTTLFRLRTELLEVTGYEAIRSRGNNFGFALLKKEWVEEEEPEE